MENPLLKLAQDYIETTNTLVFLTGKAGTGKTTFLREIRKTCIKKLAIVAPTGVAAINAGGMTIHSLFQLSFGPALPNQTERPETKYNPEKIELLQSLELLIIDEISMVRPDVLDQIDIILRTIRGNKYAFGGVQLLLIGDLAQLSPIIKEEEWLLLRRYYATPYFFSSLVLQKNDYVCIELDKVFRQSDPVFVGILNAIREQKLTDEVLGALNARYLPNFTPATGDAFITLTTHNRIAQQLNTERLEALEALEMTYKATVRGEFPGDAFPTDTILRLKVGAQVMFVKNDSSAEKRYYNGKIGIVTKLEADMVQVTTPDGLEINVEPLEWTNVKYQLTGEEISENNAGSFSQIPLKLAWAITVHKSQGLTFEKAVIDVSEAFTHGQAYVALSRCRSLDGLVLRNPVSVRNIIADPAITHFNQQTATQAPNETTLHEHQEAYRLFLLTELFNFSGLKVRLIKFETMLPDAQTEIFDVAEKMLKALPGYNEERIKKAAQYFKEKLEAASISLHQSLIAFVGNSKELAGKADELLQWTMNRVKLLETFGDLPFTSEKYLQANAQKHKLGYSFLKTLNSKPNEALFEDLMEWRETTARVDNVLPGMLFSEQTVAAIAAKLPATLKALSGIKGIGPEKTNRYGAALLTIIRAYQKDLSGAKEQSSLF